MPEIAPFQKDGDLCRALSGVPCRFGRLEIPCPKPIYISLCVSLSLSPSPPISPCLYTPCILPIQSLGPMVVWASSLAVPHRALTEFIFLRISFRALDGMIEG